MLVHLGLAEHANKVQNAWLKTLEDGILTGDIARGVEGATVVGTDAFADAVIERLGREPERLAKAAFRSSEAAAAVERAPKPRPAKDLAGVDVFIDWDEAGRDPDVLGRKLEELQPDSLKLRLITNRGVKVYPEGFEETFRTDHWRCRFLAPDGAAASHADVIELLRRIAEGGLDFIKTEHLCRFDGERGWSLGQGE